MVINDINEAYRAIIGSTYLCTFLKAIKQNKIDINNLAITSPKQEYNYQMFDIENLINDQLVKFFKSEYNNILIKNSIPDSQINAINNYIQNHLKLNFYILLEEESLIYKIFIDYYKKDRYKIDNNLFKKELYEVKTSQDFCEIVFNDSAGLTLQDLYIQPYFQVHKNCFKEDYIYSQHRFSNNYHSSKFIVDLFNIDKNNFFDELDVQNPNTIFIAAYPGQGKSSLCKELFYQQQQNNIFEENLLLIKLKDIHNPKELLTDIKQCIQNHINFEINFNNYIILLDGLDELYMRSGLTLEDVDSICHNIIREQFKSIVTTRHQYIDFDTFHEKNCFLLSINKFNYNQQSEWLSIYSSKHSNISLTVQQLDIIHNKESYSHLRELISQPILLHMITSLNIYKIEDNLTKEKLYKLFFELLLERGWEKNQSTLFEFFNKKDYKKQFRLILQEIAFKIYLGEHEYIQQEELLKLSAVKKFNNIMVKENSGNKTFLENLKGLMISFYFQESTQESIQLNSFALEFLHKSLMEYLVSEKLLYEILQLQNHSIENLIKIFWDIFGNKLISDEILLNIKNIAHSIDDAVKINALETLTLHINSFFEKQFIPDNVISTTNSIDKALNSFYGLWSIFKILNTSLTTLQPYEIKITSENFTKIVKLFKSINPEKGIDFSNLQLFNFDFSGINLNNVKFTNSNLEKSIFTNTHLNNINMDNCILNKVDFQNSYFKNVSMKASSLIEANLLGVKFENVNFVEANLYGVYIDKKDISLLKKNEIIDSHIKINYY